jgi:release factor glutamine methyltransferase
MPMRRTVSVNDPLVASGGTGVVTVRQVIDELTENLKTRGLPDARRNAHDIITSILGVPRSWALRHRDVALDPDVIACARKAAARLLAGAPFAYAVGRATFRHFDLHVDPRVLIPRPETEVLVDEILTRFRPRFTVGSDWGTAVEIGTGSGAIALSLAAEGKFSRVVATDASLDALIVARKNAELFAGALHCPVEFRSGSFLAPVRDLRARLIVSNPPYVAFDEIGRLPASVRDWEPPAALLSGSQGLAATAAIVQEGASLLEAGGILALEVDERRASIVAEMMMSAGNYIDVGVRLDLTGRERFVFASRA